MGEGCIIVCDFEATSEGTPVHHPLLTPSLTLLGAALMTGAFASDPQGSTHPCAAMQDAADRLACYDKAFGRSAEVDEAPVAAAAAAARARQDFGLSEAEKRARAPDADKEVFPDQVEAVVASIGYRGTGEMIVTLDNGQVWVQAESVTNARLRAGDTVTVRKAALGSYQLLTPGRIAMRVRRVR